MKRFYDKPHVDNMGLLGSMTLYRSEIAKDELASKTRKLKLRERSALFMANGQRTRQELQELLQDDGSLLEKLIEAGYLLVEETVQAQASPVQTGLAPAAGPIGQLAEPLPPAVSDPKGADNFEGKRSLATTRMFLFDICERMFVRKMPALANHYRDQLREARDLESMMNIARDIILNVEELAGPERANSIMERIAMLLPVDSDSLVTGDSEAAT